MAASRTTDKPSDLSLADFFSANDARRDRWSRLAACAEAWGAGRGSADKLKAEIASLLDEVEPLEQYWAYPGAGLMKALRGLVTDGDAQFTLENGDFNVRSFRSNVVLRWEWRPGSTIYTIWQQNRFEDRPTGEHVGVSDLFGGLGAPGDNIFAIKMTVWLSR